MYATNIKSSQGSIAQKNATMKRTTCNFIPRSACKYCGIRHARTHTGWWRRVSHRQEAENRGIEQTGEGDTAVDTRPRGEQRAQTAGRSQRCQTVLCTEEVSSDLSSKHNFNPGYEEVRHGLVFMDADFEKKTATLTLWRPVQSCLLGDVCAARGSSPGSAPFYGV